MEVREGHVPQQTRASNHLLKQTIDPSSDRPLPHCLDVNNSASSSRAPRNINVGFNRPIREKKPITRPSLDLKRKLWVLFLYRVDDV